MDNTTDTLQIQIKEAINELSQESREAIDSVNWRSIVLGMNKKYNPEQLENLETETELLLCGITNPDNYGSELEKRMKITKEESGLLINEMDRLIFKKIQEELEKKISRKETPVVATSKSFIPDPNFAELPKNVQEAISASNWKEKLYATAQKYKLNVEQSGILEDITTKVIKNVIHGDQYEGEISSKIAIPKEDIPNLVNDVNENILKTIRTLMQNPTPTTPKPNEGIKNIPIPPYKTIKNEELEIKNGGQTQTPVETPKPVNPIKEVLNSVPIPSVMEEKLKSATVSDHAVSDYSAPKISSPASDTQNTNQPPRSSDPYRETF